MITKKRNNAMRRTSFLLATVAALALRLRPGLRMRGPAAVLVGQPRQHDLVGAALHAHAPYSGAADQRSMTPNSPSPG